MGDTIKPVEQPLERVPQIADGRLSPAMLVSKVDWKIGAMRRTGAIAGEFVAAGGDFHHLRG